MLFYDQQVIKEIKKFLEFNESKSTSLNKIEYDSVVQFHHDIKHKES
jgi:hypothetical protein